MLQRKVSSATIGIIALAAIMLVVGFSLWQLRLTTAQEPMGQDAPPWPVDRGSGERTVVTIAGGGPADAEGEFRDGEALSARFSEPHSVALDSRGNLIVADFGNNRIRRITPSGSVETLAGTGEPGADDGPALQATFNGPAYLFIGSDDTVYVTDATNHKVRKISPKGSVSTVAGSGPVLQEKDGALQPTRFGAFRDGAASQAQFDQPAGIVVDKGGNIYVADKNNHRIRRIAPNGTVSTFAGNGEEGVVDGRGERARIAFPVGLAIDEAGNLYVTQQGGNNFAIRKIDPSGAVTTILWLKARSYLAGISVDASGTIYVADGGASQIRLIQPDGSTTALAGGVRGLIDGKASDAAFGYITDVHLGPDGTVYVADLTNNRIRAVEED